MVVDVIAMAYDPQCGIYDAEHDTFEGEKFNTSVYTWEYEKVDEYFADITNTINKPINDFYLLISFEYYNELIKKFVETAKKYDIKQIHILNHYQMDAVLALRDLDNDSDGMWLFSCRINEIRCAIWKKLNHEYLYMYRLVSEDRTTSFSTIQDLQELKNRIRLTCISPTVVFLQREMEFTESDCAQAFYDYPKKYLHPYGSTFMSELLNIIQWQKNNKIPYKIKPMLGRCIFVKYNEIFVVIENDCNLPFENKYIIDVKPDNMRLKIYENTTSTQTITLNKLGETFVKLKIDINGIFTIDVEQKGVIPYNFVGSSPNKTVFNIPSRHTTYERNLNSVGIDLGTTECCAYVIRRNGPEGVVLDPVTNQRTLPSYISVDDRGQPCGQNVINRMETKAEFSAFDVKRLMGKELNEIDLDPLWPYKVINYCEQIHLIFGQGKGFWLKSTVDICACLFRQIKEKIDEFQGAEITDAVITLPSSFTEKQKDATTDAANDGGWENVIFLKEPIAALLAYCYEMDIPEKSKVLLFDCGGGTTDICIASILDNKIEILSDYGDSHLGGKDFDKLLINYFNDALRKYGLDVLETNKKYRLMIKCQEIKHTLSTNMDDRLYVDDFKCDEDDAISITQEEFESLAADLIHRAKNLISESLSNAKLHRDDINFVFQVGGGCRMPMIKKMLSKMFPNAQQQCSIHPEELVAKGAALYAYSLNPKNDH